VQASSPATIESMARPGRGKLPLCLPLLLALLCAPASALTIDGRSRVHAVIGQPLALVIPLSVSGAAPTGVEVQVTPAPGLADEEEAVAESVKASYDPLHSSIRLSTAQRVLVPAIRLHLVISADAFVVEHDFDLLVDLPDFNREYERGAAPDTAQTAPAGDDDGSGIRLLATHGEENPATHFGDSAATPRPASIAAADATTSVVAGAATDASVAAPAPQPATDTTPIASQARHRPPKTYAVHRGETLSTIAAQLATADTVPAASLKLALYEANPQAFTAAAPEHPIAGKELRVPDPVLVRNEPRERVSAFEKYLRHPLGNWKPPSFVSFGEASLEQAPHAGAHADFFRAILTVTAAALVLLCATLLVRRMRPRLHITLPSLPRLRMPHLRFTLPARAAPAAKPPELRKLPLPAADTLSDASAEEEIRHLRQMLKQQPWRSDLRFQLAQRMFKSGDAKGFGEVAAALKQVLNEEAWGRVCAMGQVLLPADPRFLN